MMNKNEPINYRATLAQILADRQAHNPSYSLRSFARGLGVSPATLSLVLAGKRSLSRKAAVKVATKCGIKAGARRDFLASSVENTGIEQESKADKLNLLQVELDKFSAVSDWHHWGLLALAGLKESRSDPSWIARKLAISIKTAKVALQRLLRLNWIQVNGQSLKRANDLISVPGGSVGSSAIRKFHSRTLQLATKALNDVPADERDFSTIVFACN